MVKEKKIDGKTLFFCDVCGLGYLARVAAGKCEEYCRKYGACNVEISKNAVYFPGLTNLSQSKLKSKD